MTGRPTLGITSFSFTNEWVSGQLTLPELFRRVAAEGIGPAVELVGFQVIRDFPHVSSEFVREFRNALEANELVPSCLALNVDTALRRDRYLTIDEKVDYLLPQIEAARLLGFPVVRIQIGADAEVLARIAPVAEKAGIKLGMEVHAPDSAESPRVLKVVELYDRIDSPALGFIPDFSSTMHSIAPNLLQSFIDQGYPEELTPELKRIWAEDGEPGERVARFREMSKEGGASDTSIGIATFAFMMNGHAAPSSWQKFGDRIFHVHAKFYGIDEAGDEPSMDTPAILAALVQTGFSGTISSEWEAHSVTLEKDLDTFNLIRRHQGLLRRGLDAAGV